jgi:hypothetical protein
MQPCILTKETLDLDEAVASSVVPVTIGASQVGREFQFQMGAGVRIAWSLTALFTLGATGGFRFLANGPAAPAVFNAQFHVVDLTTPARFDNGQVVEAAFANASAVAGTYTLQAAGTIVSAAAGLFALQFAQNTSDVLPITMLAGANDKEVSPRIIAGTLIVSTTMIWLVNPGSRWRNSTRA